MRRLLTGCLATALLLLNTLVFIGPLLVFALIKLAVRGRHRERASATVGSTPCSAASSAAAPRATDTPWP